MAHCAAIDPKAADAAAAAAAAPVEQEGKTVEKRGLHLGDYHHHHHHEHIKTVTIEKKVPVPYTVTKHVPYTVEKKVNITPYPNPTIALSIPTISSIPPRSPMKLRSMCHNRTL